MRIEALQLPSRGVLFRFWKSIVPMAPVGQIPAYNLAPMGVDAIARSLEDFLAEAPNAVVVEGGEVIFDFVSAKYACSAERGKCLLHLWSEERNTVRRVLDSEMKNGALRLTVQRFGQARPGVMEICRDRDRRTPTARKAARASYQRLLERLLKRSFPELTPGRMSTAADLERSFGPVYTRGELRRGNSCWAVLGVNAQEPQAAIDASVTFGLLWLDACRSHSRGVVEGLKLFLPAGSSAIARERMALLNHQAARFELYELDEREGSIEPLDARDRGNIATRLAHAPNQKMVRQRFAAAIARAAELLPEAETHVLSSTELAFRLHGLEFARAQVAQGPGFRNVEGIVFGAGPYQATLTDENAAEFAGFVRAVREARQPNASHTHPLWRMQPERWLESLVARDVSALDSRLDPACAYSQVPAFSASDRAMIDVLTLTRERRLAVVELKADEDIHLPLQGLDYWARVEWHRARGEFQKFGYFPGVEIAPAPPLLFLVAPALHVHPATDTLLRYIAPEIECELIGIGEKWREGIQVVFRKRRQNLSAVDSLRRAESKGG